MKKRTSDLLPVLIVLDISLVARWHDRAPPRQRSFGLGILVNNAGIDNVGRFSSAREARAIIQLDLR